MLKTPVQYEPAFDRLNEVRPLTLADRAKINLDIPVLNANPVSQSRRAAGKLLQSNNVGGLIKNSGVSFENVLYRDCQLSPGNPIEHINTIESCKGVLATFTGGVETTHVFWIIFATGSYIAELRKDTYIWLPFTGGRMYFKGEDFDTVWVRVKTYSFS